MEAKKILINSINQNPDCNSYLIGKLFCYAASNDCDELLVDNAKFINLVNAKQIQKIINILCDYQKYDIIMTLSEYSPKITSDMFLMRKYIYDMLDIKDSDFIKKFLIRFPEIVLNDVKIISFQLYNHGIEMIDFVVEMCYDNEDDVNEYLKDFVNISCKENNLDILKYLLEKYHNFLDDHFYCGFYNNLFATDNIKILKYMFNNYNHDYINSITSLKITRDEKGLKIKKLILDDHIIKKKLLPIWIAETFFKNFCYVNDFEYAYKIKYHYPEINRNDTIYDGQTEKLRNWLRDGCPITRMMKSANKVV